MILAEIEVLQLNLLSNVVYPAGVIETLSHNKSNKKKYNESGSFVVLLSFWIMQSMGNPKQDVISLSWQAALVVWIRIFPEFSLV